MKNLIEYYTGSDSGSRPALAELRLGPEPAMVMLFTAEADDVRLHYIDDDVVRAYVPCPGTGCPICYTGMRPWQFDLLPVLDIESSTVKVLRVRDDRRPEGLAGRLMPHLKDKDNVNKVILLRRDGAVYTVEARPLGSDAKRCEVEIKAFLDDVEKGLRLDSAFRHMTPEELADVPKIQKRLEALGGWKPPRRRTAPKREDDDDSGLPGHT